MRVEWVGAPVRKVTRMVLEPGDTLESIICAGVRRGASFEWNGELLYRICVYKSKVHGVSADELIHEILPRLKPNRMHELRDYLNNDGLTSDLAKPPRPSDGFKWSEHAMKTRLREKWEREKKWAEEEAQERRTAALQRTVSRKRKTIAAESPTT